MILEVFYRDRQRVGRLAEEPRSNRVFFQYDQNWIDSGIELSPFSLPLSVGSQPVRHYDFFNRFTFYGLHGLFADCLPRAWGNALMVRRFAQLGLGSSNAGVLFRLSCLGDRGMGALSFRPDADAASQRLIEAASLAEIDLEAVRFKSGSDETCGVRSALIAAGTPPGGARPKVLALVQGDSVRVEPGMREGWEPWIIKLSEGRHANAGRIEFAYSLMATAAGLVCPATRLFDGRFFGARRFDRVGCEKQHVHTLGGLLQETDASYEDLASTALELTRDMRVLEEVFRRVTFNVGAYVRDDHVQNVAFLLDHAGHWSLAPCYDLTPNDIERIPPAHSMTVGGSECPGATELLEFARAFAVPNSRAILDQVRDSLARWPHFARASGLDESTTANVQTILIDGLVALRPPTSRPLAKRQSKPRKG